MTIETMHTLSEENNRLADENEALRAERDQATEAVQKLTEGVPFGEIVGMHTIANMERSIKALTNERDELAAKIDLLGRSMHEVANKYDGNDSTEWSIGANHVFKLFVKHICSALKKTPAISLAHIRAAGAREALERAMQEAGFSGTVVRVDVMREIIEQMEGES